MTARAPDRSGRSAVLALAVFALALALRLYGIGSDIFTRDEIEEMWGASHTLPHIKDYSGTTIGSWYVQHFWQAMGDTETRARLLPALVNALAAPLLLCSAWLVGWRIATLAALLFALNPTQVYYAQMVNEYAYLATVAAALLALAGRSGVWTGLTMGLVAAAGFWLQPATAFVSVPLLALWTWRVRKATPVVVAALVSGAGVYALWAYHLGARWATRQSYIGNLNPPVTNYLTDGPLAYSMEVLFRGLAFTVTPYERVWPLTAVLMLAALVGLGYALYQRHPKAMTGTAVAVVPVALLWLASGLGYFAFFGRYVAALTVPLTLALAYALSTLASASTMPRVTLAMVATVLVLAGVSLHPRVLPDGAGEEWVNNFWQQEFKAEMAEFSGMVRPTDAIWVRDQPFLGKFVLRSYTGPDVPVYWEDEVAIDDVLAQHDSVWAVVGIFWDTDKFAAEVESRGYTLVERKRMDRALWNAYSTLAYRFTKA